MHLHTDFSDASARLLHCRSDLVKGIGNAPSVPGCISDAGADKWRAVFEQMFPPQKKKEAQADLTMVEAEQVEAPPPIEPCHRAACRRSLPAETACCDAAMLPTDGPVARHDGAQFAEEGIDELRKQKRAELVKMRKAAAFEEKMRAAGEFEASQPAN